MYPLVCITLSAGVTSVALFLAEETAQLVISCLPYSSRPSPSFFIIFHNLLLELRISFFCFFPHLFIFSPQNFTELPRNGVIQSQIRIVLPKNSVKDLRTSENYPTYGGSSSLLPEFIHIHKGQGFQLKEHENLLNTTLSNV